MSKIEQQGIQSEQGRTGDDERRAALLVDPLDDGLEDDDDVRDAATAGRQRHGLA